MESELKFIFKLLDDEATQFCEDIVKEMVSLLSITEDEALKRVNSHWSHLEVIGGLDELIYHEKPSFWAQEIYYGSDSYWWIGEEKRKKMGLPKLAGKAFS